MGEADERCLVELLPTSKESYILQGHFSEYVPVRVIQALRSSQLIPETSDQDFANDNDDNDVHKKPRLLFESFAATVSEAGFSNPTLVPPKGVNSEHFWGRVYPAGMRSIAGLTRRVRNTLCTPRPEIGYCGWYDFDMVNAHPSLVLDICSQHSDAPNHHNLKYFCENRPSIIQNIKTIYGLAEDEMAKDLLIRLFFGGTCAGWYAANRRFVTTQATMAEMPLFAVNLQAEIGAIATWLKTKNPRLWNSCRHNAENQAKARNSLGKFFARFCQTYETMIMNHLIYSIVTSTTCASFQDRIVLSYEYDGVKLLREPVDVYIAEKAWTLEDLTTWFSQVVFEKFKVRVAFKAKELTPVFALDNISAVERTYDELPIFRFYQELTNVSPNGNIHGFSSHGCIAKFVIQRDKNFMFDEVQECWYAWSSSDQAWICYNKHQSPILLRNAVSEVDRYLTERRDAILSQLELPDYDTIYDWDPSKWLTSASHISDAGQTRLKACFDQITKIQKEVATDMYVSAVVNMCRDYAHMREVKFNENKDTLGFKNGLFELKDMIFRPFQKADLITYRCGIELEPDDADMLPKKQEMMRHLERIFPDVEIREFMLRVYGTSLTGYPVEHFFICNGGGRNGKSFLHLVLHTLLGDDYALCNLDPKLLTQQIQANAPVPELADLTKKRLVITKEPAASAKLQNDTLKTLTGGAKGLRARQLYGKMIDVDMCLTMVMECNKKPKLADEPTFAEQERIMDVEFASRFTSEPQAVDESQHVYLADPTLKDEDKIKSLAVAFFWILAPYAQHFLTNGLRITPVPAKVKERTKAYMKSAFLVLKVFQDLYEDADGNGEWNWTPLTEILKKLKQSEEYHLLDKRDKGMFTEDHLHTSLKLEYPHRIQHIQNHGRLKICLANVKLIVDPVLGV